MDRAARTTDKRMRDIESRAKAAGKMLGSALTAGAGIAAAGMGLYIKNTIEAEKVQAQLGARIKDTMGAAGRSLEQLNANAEKLQGLTIFDDEAIGNVQAMLLTFKEIKGGNFDEATAAVLDLSTAMGGDAVSAATQLGKALNDPIKGVSALAKAGIQFSDDQKKVIKALVETGDVAGAQRIILDELAGQMGTAAEAARNTLGGALQALRNSFDNLLEGDTSKGGMRGAVQAIEDLNRTMNDPGLKSGIDTIVEGMFRISGAALTAAGKFGQAVDAYQKFLSDRGLMPADENSSIEQMVARREKLQGLLERMDTGRTVWGAETVRGIRAEVAELDGLLGEIPKAQSYMNLPELLGGNPAFSAIGFSAIDYTKGATPKASGGGTKSKTGGKAAKQRDMPDFAKEAADETRKAVEAVAAAQEQFDAWAAQLAGPVADAAYQFSVDQERLNELARTGEIDTAKLAAAQEQLRAAYEKNIEAINAQLTPAQEVNAAIAEEIMLLGMSAEAQEIYNNLKAAGVDANSAFGQSIIESTEQLQAAREEAELMASIKDGLSDVFVDFVSGAKSAKEAFGDFADLLFRKALEFVANKAIQAMFDAFSSQGAGSYTGNGTGAGSMASFGNMISSFGGGRASGGPVSARSFYEVGEHNQPELLKVRGRQYLIPGNNGQVTPMGRGGGFTQVINQNYAAPNDPRTRDQMAKKVSFETQRAMTRNR